MCIAFRFHNVCGGDHLIIMVIPMINAFLHANPFIKLIKNDSRRLCG